MSEIDCVYVKHDYNDSHIVEAIKNSDLTDVEKVLSLIGSRR